MPFMLSAQFNIPVLDFGIKYQITTKGYANYYNLSQYNIQDAYFENNIPSFGLRIGANLKPIKLKVGFECLWNYKSSHSFDVDEYFPAYDGELQFVNNEFIAVGAHPDYTLSYVGSVEQPWELNGYVSYNFFNQLYVNIIPSITRTKIERTIDSWETDVPVINITSEGDFIVESQDMVMQRTTNTKHTTFGFNIGLEYEWWQFVFNITAPLISLDTVNGEQSTYTTLGDAAWTDLSGSESIKKPVTLSVVFLIL
ncbi:MAG: hypothetical protein CMP56_05165 [Flavobacteriales bacterium]|nr:hypothetical protein [Flavobacteriales bacterium]